MKEKFEGSEDFGRDFPDELSIVGKWPGEAISDADDELDKDDDDEPVPEVQTEFAALTAEEVEVLRKQMFAAGVYGFWSVRQSVAQRIHESACRLSDKYVALETKAVGDVEAARRFRSREEEVEALRAIVNDALPPWQQISGITTVGEHFENPNQRAAGIRRLLSGIERLLRFEMSHSPAPETAEECSSVCLDRSFQWDPLRVICLQYQIAQRRLSGFAKELTGMSAIEIVDGIRAEKVRARMKMALKEFILSRKDAKTQRTEGTGEGVKGGKGDGPHPRPLSHEGRRENGNSDLRSLAEEIYAELKDSRRSPRFHRAQWAIELGFSSYQRFFRACLLCYGMTPHQLEIVLIDEILAEAENGNGGREDHEGEQIGHEVDGGDEREEIVKRE